MNYIRIILVVALLGIVNPRADATDIQSDLLELKTTYPNSTARTIYKGPGHGKIENLELHDSSGVIVLKLDKYEGTLQELFYFKDPTFNMHTGADSIDREVDILIDSLKTLKLRTDKNSLAVGTIFLWINEQGAVEHAVWFWYIGLSRLYLRKSMVYAENWKIKMANPGKGFVVRRNVDFK